MRRDKQRTARSLTAVLDDITRRVANIKKNLELLVTEYSGIQERFPDQDSDSLVVITPNRWMWTSLSLEGLQVQSRLLTEYRHFSDVMKLFLRRLPESARESFDEAEADITVAIEQDAPTGTADKKEVLARALAALQEQLSLLERVPCEIHAALVVIPDTNALLATLPLDQWTFDDGPVETILLPTVLSELDRLKMQHTVPRVREKAQALIRQIAEYRRRGKLTEGVTLVKGVSRVRAIAVEPDFETAPSWLDSENADDRILASTLDIMRLALRSTVQLVTGDVNLQNKAEFCQIPCVPHDEYSRQ